MMSDNPDPRLAELQERLMELENENANLRAKISADVSRHGDPRPFGSDEERQLGVCPSAMITNEKPKPQMESNQHIPGIGASTKQPFRNNTFATPKDPPSASETSFETRMTVPDQATTGGMNMDATHTNGTPSNGSTASLINYPSGSNAQHNQVSQRWNSDRMNVAALLYKRGDKVTWKLRLSFPGRIKREFHGFQTEEQAKGAKTSIIGPITDWKAKNGGTIPSPRSDNFELFITEMKKAVDGFKVTIGLKPTRKLPKQNDTWMYWLNKYATGVATYYLKVGDRDKIDQLMSLGHGADVSVEQSDRPLTPDVSTLAQRVANNALTILQSKGRGKCSEEDCANLAYSGGVCIPHGATAPPRQLCKIDGCPNVTYRKGFCEGHHKQLAKGVTEEELEKATKENLLIFATVRNINARKRSNQPNWAFTTTKCLGLTRLTSSSFKTKEHADIAAGLLNGVVITWKHDHDGKLPEEDSEDWEALDTLILQAVNTYRKSINLYPTKRSGPRVKKPVKGTIAEDDGDSAQASEEKPATKRKRKSALRSSDKKPPPTKRKRISSETGTDDSGAESSPSASTGARRGRKASDDDCESSESETDYDEAFDTESD